MTIFSSILQIFSSFTPGKQLIDGGDLSQMANMLFSATGAATSPTAKAGGGTAGTLMNYYINRVDTVAADNDSVVINTPAIPGASVIVDNNGGHTLAVYGLLSNPNNAGAADQIIPHASVAAGASTTQATGVPAIYFCSKLGIWKQLLSA